MSITRIDLSIYHRLDLGGGPYSVLNPTRQPGALVGAYVEAARSGLGSKVACTIAIESFASALLSQAELSSKNAATNTGQLPLNLETQSDRNLALMEQAFREANISAYEFGHKLSAGGRLAANMLGLIIRDDVMAVGRVGLGAVFLERGGELFPFFEDSNTTSNNFIGSNSMVNVELASVPIEEGDLILVFGKKLQTPSIKSLNTVLADEVVDLEHAAQNLAKRLYPTTGDLQFVMVAKVGPKTIYLKQKIEEPYG